MYLARRVPYVWDNTRGALSYDDVASEVGRFLWRAQRRRPGEPGPSRAGRGARRASRRRQDARVVRRAKLFLENGRPGSRQVPGAICIAAAHQGASESYERRRSPTPCRSSTKPSMCRGKSTSSGRSCGATFCRRSSRAAKVTTRGCASANRPPCRQQIATQAKARAGEGWRRRSRSRRAVRVQAGLPLDDRARHSRAQGKRRARDSRQGRRVQARLLEEIQVLPGAEPLGARAVSGRRDRRARARDPEGAVLARAGRFAARTSTPSKRSTRAVA